MILLPSKLAWCSLLLLAVTGCTALRNKSATPAAATSSTKPRFENVLIAQSGKGFLIGPCEPSICINPLNTRNMAAGAVLDGYFWSNDGGRSWSTGHLKSSYGVYGDPTVVADSLGNFYYAHLSAPETNGWESRLLDRIVIQRSSDGGKTYNDGGFCGERHPKDQDKQWLCVDPANNHLYCTWTEFDKYGSKDTANHHSRILFSKSADRGDTWSTPLAINQFEGDSQDDDYTTEGAVPAVGPRGEVYVAWAWNDKIWFDRSLDGGKSWLEKDVVIADQPGGWTIDIPGLDRSNGMPVLVCDRRNGALYVNWADQRNGAADTDIWVAKSTDGGQSWSKPKRVNDDAPGKQQFLTWLAVDQVTGFLYVVFYDRRAYDDERTDVYVAVSRDGGLTFENMKISGEPFKPNFLTFFGDYSNISAHNGVVRPIWTRLEKGVQSVWTAIMDGL